MNIKKINFLVLIALAIFISVSNTATVNAKTTIYSPQPVAFIGVFTPNLKDVKNITIELKSNGQLIILGGCSALNATYTAYNNGSFALSKFKRILKSCNFDQDAIYVKALFDSKKF
jgi:hypothetical protein